MISCLNKSSKKVKYTTLDRYIDFGSDNDVTYSKAKLKRAWQMDSNTNDDNGIDCNLRGEHFEMIRSVSSLIDCK